MSIGYESIQVYATLPGCPSRASHSHNIIYYSPTADSPPPPLKKGNSQVDSSVQDNPAASTPFYTIKSTLEFATRVAQ
jgi:hypothetical protein